MNREQRQQTEIERRAIAKQLAEQMAKLSNESLTKELLKKFQDDEHVSEILKRFDECLDCMTYPHLYYKRDAEDFINGKTTSLKKADL